MGYLRLAKDILAVVPRAVLDQAELHIAWVCKAFWVLKIMGKNEDGQSGIKGRDRGLCHDGNDTCASECNKIACALLRDYGSRTYLVDVVVHNNAFAFSLS